MTNNLPLAGRPPAATVYDVNGIEVGTVEEIFGASTSPSTSTSTITHTRQSEAE